MFPGRGKTGHLLEIKAAWLRVLARAGIEDLRPHDLRRSLASWMALQGVPLLTIGKALGHQDPQSTAVCARLTLDPVRAGMTAAAQAMMQAARHAKGADNGQDEKAD